MLAKCSQFHKNKKKTFKGIKDLKTPNALSKDFYRAEFISVGFFRFGAGGDRLQNRC